MFTGGARGADFEWADAAHEAGHEVVNFSFPKHGKSKAPGKWIDCTEDQLQEADEWLIKASKRLGKKFSRNFNPYVLSLLRRNYQIIKNADAIYGVGTIAIANVEGGTGWGFAMAMEINPEHRSLYFYDQEREMWFWWQAESNTWIGAKYLPTPEGKWAGIGTREINTKGAAAIKLVLMPRTG
jgi:hypothetical protein